MAQYINFEAEAEFIDANSGKEDDEISLISESDSFIDDQEVESDSINLVMLKGILMRS